MQNREVIKPIRQRTLHSIFAALLFVFGLAMASVALSSVATRAAYSAESSAVPTLAGIPEQGKSLGSSSADEHAGPAAAGWADVQPFPTYAVDISPTPPPGSGVLRAKRVGAAAYPPDGKVYMLGGRHGADGEDVPLRDIWEYDPDADTWARKAARLDALAVGSRWTANMAVAALTDTNGVRIYAIGGSSIDSAITNTVRVYNPVADTLTTLTSADNWPASPERLPGGYAVYDNKLYIFGGFSALGTGAVFSDTWVFDPMGAVGDKWSQLVTAPLSLPRGYIAGATLDGKIYAIGGDTWNPGPRLLVPQIVVERLDPGAANPSWTTVASLPSPAGDMGAWAYDSGTGYSVSGNIVVAGGTYPVPNAKAFIYSPASNSWSPFPALVHATRNYGVAQLDGLLYALGGYDYSNNIPDGANFNQMYDATGPAPTATNTPINSPTPTGTPCNANYTISSFGGAAIVPGTSLVPGSTCGDEDCTVTVTLPFPYTLYDQSFTSARLAVNGNVGFVVADANPQVRCLPDPAASWAIFGYWDDLNTNGIGTGIYTSVMGVAPNRVFNIEWRGSRSTRVGGGTVNFEIRLFEGQTSFEIIYGTVAGGGDTAVVGVQRDSGSLFAQYTCLTPSLSAGQRLLFQLPGGVCPTVTPTFTPSNTFTPANTRTSTPTITGTPPTPTSTPVCAVVSYISTDVPVPILDNSTINSTLTVAGAGSIFDIDLVNLNVTHSFLGDLRVYLTSPGGTTVLLVNNVCGFADNYDNIALDDEAVALIGTTCPPAVNASYRPSNPLTALDGQEANGTWTLAVADTGQGDEGVLSGWGVRITSGLCGTSTPTGTPTHTGTPTNTPTITNTPLTPFPTATATPTIVTFVGHVSMEGRPAQPHPLQSVPVTLTLRLSSGGPVAAYGSTTDLNGIFTVTVPPGAYHYKVKNPMTLANAGTMSISGSTTPQELGLLRAADATDDNCVDIADFNVLKNSFGRSSGDPQFDPAADFDGSETVDVSDFSLLKGRFGTCGDDLPAAPVPAGSRQ